MIVDRDGDKLFPADQTGAIPSGSKVRINRSGALPSGLMRVVGTPIFGDECPVRSRSACTSRKVKTSAQHRLFAEALSLQPLPAITPTVWQRPLGTLPIRDNIDIEQ